MIIRVLLIIFFVATTCVADDTPYWSIELPIMEGAQNIEQEKDDKHFIISTTYDLSIDDPDKVHEFYKTFFESISWENPMKGSPVPNRAWQSYHSGFNKNDKPEFILSSRWKAKDIPAIGSLRLTLLEYEKGLFKTIVNVKLAPEIDSSQIFKLQQIIMKDPKNIFLLYEAIGCNPFEIDKATLNPELSDSKIEIVREYYETVETILSNYKEFGSRYINN